MENTSQRERLEEIRNRLSAFLNAGVSWRITVANPYVSSSTYMQEWGSHPEKVMQDFLSNITSDVEFLLEHCGSD